MVDAAALTRILETSAAAFIPGDPDEDNQAITMNPNNCSTCDHKKNPDGGHCYMFRNAPTDVCMQHTGRRAVATMDALMAVFGMRRAETGTERK